ncbi:MAG: hypothetical protein R3E01_21585 [Pirellulaceae bacterium]
MYNRCVRGLFMLGETEQEGEVVKFRRGWVTELMQQMVAIVLIDIAFFATMDNHVHVIGRNRPGVGGHLTDREVASVVDLDADATKWDMVGEAADRGADQSGAE